MKIVRSCDLIESSSVLEPVGVFEVGLHAYHCVWLFLYILSGFAMKFLFRLVNDYFSVGILSRVGSKPRRSLSSYIVEYAHMFVL